MMYIGCARRSAVEAVLRSNADEPRINSFCDRPTGSVRSLDRAQRKDARCICMGGCSGRDRYHEL
jgi:hypothetical protein